MVGGVPAASRMRRLKTPDVGAGCGFDGSELSTAELRRGPAGLAGSVQRPIRPVLPPRTGSLLGLDLPSLWVRLGFGTGEEMCLWVAGRVDEARDVAGVAQHEGA